MPPGRTTPAYVPIEEEPILTPEEQAALDAMNASIVTGAGGGGETKPIPPPDTAPVPSELYGGPAPAAGSWNDPNIVTTYDPSQSSGMGIAPVAVTDVSTGQTTPTSYAQTQEPIPSPSSTAQPQQTGGYEPLPTPTPSSPTINARASDYTALGLDPTEYLRRTYGPSPSRQGGTGLDSDRTAPGWTPGPQYQTFVDPPKDTPINQAWGRQDDSRSVPPPPAPTTNWWDPITQAAGNIIPGLVQWATPGLESGPANSARQAQDAVGNLVGAYRDTSAGNSQYRDQLDASLGVNDESTGVDWNAVFSPEGWPVFQKPRKYYDANGREMLGVGDIGFMPGEIGGIGSSSIKNVFMPGMEAGMADDLARAGTVADDAARMRTTATGETIPPPAGVGFHTESMPDGTFRIRNSTTGELLPEVYATHREVEAAVPVNPGSLAGQKRAATGEAIPEPPTGKGLVEAEPVVGSPSNATVSAPAAGGKPGGRTFPRLTKRGLAAGGAAAVVAAGVANNVLRTSPPTGPRETVPPPIGPGTYSPSTNPQTKSDWENASTRSLELMKSYSPQQFAAGVKRSAVDINGVSQKLIESNTAPGLYVGYIDTAGNVVPVGSDVSSDQFVKMVIANAAEAPAGWGDDSDAILTPDQGTSTSSANAPGGGSDIALSDVSVPAPIGSGGGASGPGGDWNTDWSGSRSSRGSSRSKEYGDDDYGDEFTTADFLDAADGDKRKAARMAAVANKRRRSKRMSGASVSSQFWQGFPFSRPNSPMREHVLEAIQESLIHSRDR